MTETPVKVLLVEDHRLLWDSFRKIYSAENGFDIVSETGSATDAERLCKSLLPELALMDVCTEGNASGLEALKRLRPAFPAMKIIMMSGFDELSYAPRAKELGADAFIFKSKSLDFFLETTRKVMAGGMYFPEPKKVPLPSGEVPLSEREMEILRLFCMHKSRADIAEQLFISEHTVKRHVENMLRKTGFATIMELVIYVLSNGWINPKY